MRINTVSRTDLPRAGVWELDPGHAHVGFTGRHFMITKIRGRFTEVEGRVTIADDPTESAIFVRIGMASVESGDATRDDHLRSADLFDAESFPSAIFESTFVEWSGEAGRITGDLTIRDATREVTLDATFDGGVVDPWGNTRAMFSASGRINREDWGITWNMPLDAGGLLVSKEIDLEIEVELVRQDAGT